MRIKYHPMSEKPSGSCRVLLTYIDRRVIPSCYSAKHNAFNVNDHDTVEDAKLMKADESLYFGWVYESEFANEMVGAYEVL